MAYAAIKEHSKHIEQQRTPKNPQMGFPLPLALHGPGQREDNCYSRYENEKWKDEVIKAKSLPVRMIHLRSQKASDRMQYGAFIS